MNPKLRVLVLVVILLWLIIYRYVQTNSSPKSQTLSEGQYDQFEEKSQLPIQRNPIEESYYRNFIRKQFANSEKSYQVCLGRESLLCYIYALISGYQRMHVFLKTT